MAGAPEALSAALSGRYQVERELGQGGMATVYLARDLRHERPVAIKVLRAELAEALGRQRFLREIQVAARLNHPHILALLDSGEAAGFLYFVMPVMQGQTLRDRLLAGTLLPVDEAIRIGIEVADALDHAHRNDVVHRDIKPENILLHEGHAIVADFGIGKALVAASAGTSAFTQVGVTVGTPAYMSPEQASGDDLDGRSDLFALGCVLYEMLTGEPAFTGTTASALIAKRFVYSPPSVAEVRPGVSQAVSQTVSRLLAREPADRFSSGAQVLSALRTQDVPVTAAPSRDDKSLAVLPFTSVGADTENELFADGLTEELITDLARVKALRVISRTSSMQLKGTTKSMRAIGRDLGVRYALEGSVRKAGASLRITAQLIDTPSDARLWADKYTGTVDDVFDLQERVSRAIVEALDVTLSSEENARLTERPVTNVRAYELYLEARLELRRYNLDRGVALLERAIAIEGEVPALRALRALALIIQVRAGLHRDFTPLDQAEAEARELLTSAPDAAYGHALLGFIGYERGELRDARRHLYAALERDPNDADIFFFLGISLMGAGQMEETAVVSRQFLAADPLSSTAQVFAGVTTWFVGRPAEGLEAMQRGVELDPENSIFHWALGYHFALLGRFGEAGREAQWMRQRAPLMPYTAQLCGLVAAAEGGHEAARGMLAAVNTTPLDGHTKFHLGEAFAMAGDTRRALELAEQAVDHNFYPHDFIARYTPFMAPLRGTPDFERILAKAARRVADFRV